MNSRRTDSAGSIDRGYFIVNQQIITSNLQPARQCRAISTSCAYQKAVAITRTSLYGGCAIQAGSVANPHWLLSQSVQPWG